MNILDLILIILIGSFILFISVLINPNPDYCSCGNKYKIARCRLCNYKHEVCINCTKICECNGKLMID